MSTSGVVTILFTDLVDSTAATALLGSAEADRLRRDHFALLAEAVTAHGGTVVKTLGDGVMAEFRSVHGALDAAAAAQQWVLDQNAMADRAGLAVRMGVSTGEATEESGDWFGLPVVEASRLCAAAQGGQVLVSATTRLLAGGPAATTLSSAGTLELKGLPHPVEAYELAWAPRQDGEAVLVLPARLEPRWAGPFVGREAECDLLETAFKASAAGERRVVLLHGEPGMGKTRLAAEAARRAHATGASVLYGRCDLELGMPYQPFVEALTHYVQHGPERVLRAHVTACGAHLARLVPELRERVAGALVAPETSPETERYRLYTSVTSLLHQAGASAPVVLLLDDLHWADKATVQLLRHLVLSRSAARVLVVATYRDADVDPASPLAQLLAELAGEPGVERQHLQGLDEGDVLSLVELTTGRQLDPRGEAFVEQVRLEAGGSPFFVSEILRSTHEARGFVEADGRLTYVGDLEQVSLPDTVLEMVRARVQRLGEDGARALTVASVIGREFDLALLALALNRSEDDVLDLLDRAVSARLVEERTDVHGRFTFSHALAQHALYDGIGATRKARLHAKVARALERLCGDDPDGRLGELAHHWLQTTDRTDLPQALQRGRQAGEHALRQLAPDEAVRWFGQSLELVHRWESFAQHERCELLVLLGDSQRQAGDPAYRETLLLASALAERLRDVPQVVRAALANNRGFVSSNGAVDAERIAVLERALAVHEDEDGPDRPRLLILLAAELTYAGDWARRRALADEAVRLARRLDDPATLSVVLTTRFTTIAAPGTLDQRLGEMTENLLLSQRVADPAARFWALVFHATASMEAGDIAAVDTDLAEAAELAAALGRPFLRWVSGWHQAWRAHVAGRCEDSEVLAGAALGIALESGEPDALAIYAGQLYGVRRDQARLEELLPLLLDAEHQNPGIPGFRAARVLALCETGHLDEARALLDEDLRADAASWHLDPLWLTTVAAYAEACWWLGDAAGARLVQELMRPWAGQVVFNSAFCQGAVSHHLGLGAAVLGDHDEADRLLALADAEYERLDAPLWRARGQVARARVLRLRGRAGDVETAGALVDSATATAERLSAPGVLLVPA